MLSLLRNRFTTASSYCVGYVRWGSVCFPEGVTSGRKGGLGEIQGPFWKLASLHRHVELRQAHTWPGNSTLKWLDFEGSPGRTACAPQATFHCCDFKSLFPLLSCHYCREKSLAYRSVQRQASAKWQTCMALISTPCSFLLLRPPREKEGSRQRRAKASEGPM